jgi:phosphatidylglycerol lysyltransferase
MTIAPHLARRLGAIFTASVGIINILSALYPAIHSRMELLRDVLPMHLIRGTQTATVLVGFFLILLADGLRKRRTRAFQLTVLLLIASGILNLTKGLDFEEASLALLVAGGLLWTRDAFDVSCAIPAPRRVVPQVVTFALLYYCYVLLGFLLLRRAIHPAPTLLAVIQEPFRLVVADQHFVYLTGQSQWFSKSLAGLGCAALLYALLQLLRPFVPHRPAGKQERSRIHALLRQYGTDTLSYFALQDGRSYFFDTGGEAFLSYRLWGTVAIVGGEPVGPAHRFPALVQAFIEYADANGMDPCFLGIAGDHVGMYSVLGLKTLKVGEEALIDLPTFSASALKRKVRRADRHIAELGIRAVRYAQRDIPTDVYDQMKTISDEWVRERGGSERGFSMTLGRLPGPDDPDCEVVVAQRDDDVLGYVCMVPAQQGRVWSLDAMRRRSYSPNGLMEFLVIQTAEMYRKRGTQTLSLNFATLANSLDDIDSRALEGTRRFLYEHLSSFYQMRSLEQFNSKFGPQWRSRYLAFRDVHKLPKLAIAIAQSEDPIKLPNPVGMFRR